MIRIQRQGGAREAVHAYRVAGTNLVSNLALPLAAAYAVRAAAGPGLPPLPPPATGAVIYDGDGWLEGRHVHARCLVRGNGFELDIGEFQRFWVAGDGGAIVELAAAPADDLGTAVLGPPLILALALRGTFALHAGAFAEAGTPRVLALCGPSGAGKSTLAAAAAENLTGRRRCADDLLALPGGEIGTARLDFPQLKLAVADQPARRLDQGAVPLRGVLWLGAPASAGLPAVRPLTGASAVSRLVASTVAARLFPPELAAIHLAFCGALAARVPIGELCYQRRHDAIPQVFAAIDRWLRRAEERHASL